MDEQAKALARYRLEKAQQVLQSADILGEAFNSRNESDYKDFLRCLEIRLNSSFAMQKGLLRLWKPI